MITTQGYATPTLHGSVLRERLSYILLATLALLLVTAAFLTYQYMKPHPQWVSLGHVDDFPVTGTPIFVTDVNTGVWVVRIDGRTDKLFDEQFIALEPIPNDISRCPISWEAYRNSFADPCRGTQYSRIGLYKFAGPPPPHSLSRYRVRVDSKGNLFMLMDRPSLGPTWEEVRAACLRHKGASPFFANQASLYLETCHPNL